MAKKAKSTRPAKLNIHIATFSYGGNGGFSSMYPEVGWWYARIMQWCQKDPRVGEVTHWDLADTPITMSRNRQVLTAREQGAHILVMMDSDQHPDLYVGTDPTAQPFFESGFNYLWEHWDDTPNGYMIGSPYCGPPPHPVNLGYENVYVFHWEAGSTDDIRDQHFQLKQYTRNEASQMMGIQPAGALPTGAIIADMRVFEITEPQKTETEKKGWFYYEWQDIYASQKASTEDVTMTRDLALTGMATKGYNPVLCNWDAWVGHYKPKCVGKPIALTVENVGERLVKAVQDNVRASDRLIHFSTERGKEVLINATHAGEAGVEYCQELVQTPKGDRMKLGRIIDAACKDAKAAGKGTLRMAEVGCWVGDTSKFIVDRIKSNGLKPVLYCVDAFQGSTSDQTQDCAAGTSVMQHFISNVGELLNNEIHLLYGESTVVASDSGLKDLDVVFIDADHSETAARADIKAWTPIVREGGILCGHDYSGRFPGVCSAVEDTFGYGFAHPGVILDESEGWVTIWVAKKGKGGKWERFADTNAAAKTAKSKKPRRSTRTKATATATTRSAGSAKGGTSARSSSTAKRKSTRKSVKPRK